MGHKSTSADVPLVAFGLKSVVTSKKLEGSHGKSSPASSDDVHPCAPSSVEATYCIERHSKSRLTVTGAEVRKPCLHVSRVKGPPTLTLIPYCTVLSNNLALFYSLGNTVSTHKSRFESFRD